MDATTGKSMDKYLIDSSIWIKYLQGKDDAVRERIQTLLDEDRISINGVIFSELLVAAGSKKEFQFIKEHFSGLHFLETNRDFYIKLAKMTKEFQRIGHILPFPDLAKIVHAHLWSHTLLCSDKKIRDAGQEVGVRFEIL